MTTPDADATIQTDDRETVLAPAAAPSSAPADVKTTIDLSVIDLRDTVAPTTVVVPPQPSPPKAPPALPAAEQEPIEVLRFGPGVPAVLTAPAVPATPAEAPQPRKLNSNHALNWTLTLALAGIVVWLLWPAGALHVRGVRAASNLPVVGCNASADVVATVTTNGNAGQLKYRWIRNDGSGSGTLLQSLSRGQRSVNLHLTWTFRGPGSYAARATVQLISPAAASATANFRYAC